MVTALLGSRASTALALPADQDSSWSAAGHDLSRAWYEVLGLVGPWVLATLLLGLVARALLRAHRYRVRTVLSEEDREPVHAALRAAEARTTGEVVPVVLERSDPHPAACWRAALLFLAVGSALLTPHLPWGQPALFLACQLALGALGYLSARWLPDFQRLFVGEERASAVAREQALQEFFSNGLFRTEGRTGVLLFVSLLERRVVVLADEGVDAVVGDEVWRDADRAVLEGVRRGSLSEGLASGIRLVGDVLARHFPAGGEGPNELPDRLIVRRE